MPEPANSYAKIPSQQQTFYDRNLLERLLKNLVFLQHGQKNKKPIPKNEGATINFRRFNSLPIPTESLTEGVTPAGKNISVSQIEAKVKQEGDYVEVTDLLDLMGYDPVITEMTEVQGEQALKPWKPVAGTSSSTGPTSTTLAVVYHVTLSMMRTSLVVLKLGASVRSWPGTTSSPCLVPVLI